MIAWTWQLHGPRYLRRSADCTFTGVPGRWCASRALIKSAARYDATFAVAMQENKEVSFVPRSWYGARRLFDYDALEMPQRNLKLSPEQRLAALEWVAACEKLGHFLRATPGYPDLSPEEVTLMMDTTESALLDLRRTFEKPT